MALPTRQLSDTVLMIIQIPRSLARSGRLASPTNVLTFLEMELSGKRFTATHPISTQAARMDASTDVSLFALVMICVT